MTDFAQGERHHLAYLEAELACIDLLLRREVRRWEVAGQDPNDDYRGLYITQAEAVHLLDLPFGVSWGQSIELPQEEEEAFSQAFAQARQRAETLGGTLTKEGHPPRLLQVAAAFRLDRTELDILLLCLAPAFATRYERVYGYLQDNVTRRRPTVRLILQLLGEAGMAQYALAHYLSREAPLFKFQLLEYVVEAPPANVHWINHTLQVDEGVVAWLRGEYQAAAVLGENARLQRIWNGTDLSREGWAGGVETGRDIDRSAYIPKATVGSSSEPIWIFYGVDGERQQIAVEQMAKESGQPLLIVQLNKSISESAPALQVVRMALRDARLTGAIPFLCGWDASLSSEDTVEPSVLQALCEHPGLVIVAGQKRWQPGGISRSRPFFQQMFDLPTYEQRLELWQNHLASQGDKVTLSPCQSVTLSELSAQFVLTSGQIRDAVRRACDQALQEGRALEPDDLFAAARTSSQSRLDALATKIVPRYSWTDLILPADQVDMLQELVATVRGRAKVLEEWGVGKKLAASAGVSALFAGPPGTGKTMAAEVIAKALGYDLYKIDLSTIVSKYIGETEKNLERIFTEASSSNAILFFDEADALFGKRSEVKDAHDRFANIEISYLLQRMERYDGVAILATNLRAHLDDAFTRRLQFIVAFPFPQRGERYLIWKSLFPSGVPRSDDLDGEFKRLAERFELTGANIRNILYSAANLAASNGQMVTKEHLRHGVRRELQKMGKTVGTGDFS